MDIAVAGQEPKATGDRHGDRPKNELTIIQTLANKTPAFAWRQAKEETYPPTRAEAAAQ